MVVSTRTWYTAIGPFPPQNDHFIRDAAALSFVIGLAAFGAVRVRSWRLPVLAGMAIQNGLHSISHLVDIDNADPEWVGVLDFVGLALSTVLLIGLVLYARRPGPAGQ